MGQVHSRKTRTREEEIEARRARGISEPMDVTRIDEGCYAVTSPRGSRYVVEILDLLGKKYRCSCPDFQGNGLGTCKHVEGVLCRISAPRVEPESAPKEGAMPAVARLSERRAAAAGKEAACPDVVFFDLETQRAFQDVGGRRHLDRLGLAVAVIYSTRDRAYEVYEEARAAELVARLQGADVVVGFNLKAFDYRVLKPYGGNTLRTARTVDILEEIKDALGTRVGLDNLALATLGRGKTGDGLQAVKWYREGRLDLVTEYCRADVEITRDLFEFGLRHGCVYYGDARGARRTVPVWWGQGDIARLARESGLVG